MHAVDVDPVDETAINDIFGSHTSVDVDENNPCAALSKVTFEPNETATIKDGKIVVTKAIDGDVEMVYTYGQKPTALRPLYRIKINDLITENIPFKENVGII